MEDSKFVGEEYVDVGQSLFNAFYSDYESIKLSPYEIYSLAIEAQKYVPPPPVVEEEEPEPVPEPWIPPTPIYQVFEGTNATET